MRYENWPIRLQSLLDHSQHRDFSWGDFDCCQWAGLAVEAQTGDNPLSDTRGRYSTEVGAKRVLINSFGGSLSAGWTQLLGEPVEPAYAGRGDIVLVDIDGAEAIGVVDLSGERIACLGQSGLTYLPTTAALAAWKV